MCGNEASVIKHAVPARTAQRCEEGAQRLRGCALQALPMMEALAAGSSSSANDTLPDTAYGSVAVSRNI